MSHVGLVRLQVDWVSSSPQKSIGSSPGRPISAPIFILLYGRDSRLLATRQLVLEVHGYTVRTTTELAEIERITSIDQVHLIIVCHSVSVEETAHALYLTGSRLSGIKSLVLLVDTPNQRGGVLGEVLYAMDGPAKLVLSVQRLVGPANSAARSEGG